MGDPQRTLAMDDDAAIVAAGRLASTRSSPPPSSFWNSAEDRPTVSSMLSSGCACDLAQQRGEAGEGDLLRNAQPPRPRGALPAKKSTA
jgi:hypothetical protein